jgi:hypothetical protein
MLMDGYYYLLASLAAVALVVGFRRRERWAAFAGLVLLYWTAVHVVFYGEPRLHVPLHPLMAVAAAVALRAASASLRRRCAF